MDDAVDDDVAAGAKLHVADPAGLAAGDVKVVDEDIDVRVADALGVEVQPARFDLVGLGLAQMVLPRVGRSADDDSVVADSAELDQLGKARNAQLAAWSDREVAGDEADPRRRDEAVDKGRSRARR